MNIKEIIDSARSGQIVYDLNPHTEMGYILTHKGKVLTKSKFYIGDEIVAITDTYVGNFSYTKYIKKGEKLIVTRIAKSSDYCDANYYVNDDGGFAYLFDSDAFARYDFKPERAAEYLLRYSGSEIIMRKDNEKDVHLYNKNGIVWIDTESGLYEYDIKDLKNLIHAFYNAGYKICR